MVDLSGLFCLAVVAALVVVAVVWFLRQRAKRAAASRARPVPVDPFRDADADALRGDPRLLKAGDVLDAYGETLMVRGTLRMREGGYQWAEHLIDTGGGIRRWLSVEEDPDLELVLWKEVESEAPPPGPRTVELEGVTYRLRESGQAQYLSEASTGLATNGTVRYYDYEAATGAKLSYEDFRGNGNYEVATGRLLDRSLLTIYPRDSR